MKLHQILTIWLLISLGSIFLFSQEYKSVSLPIPIMEGGKPLMQVLKERQSSRLFSNEKLSLQTLSNLLWAACGINRPENGKRTAPSSRNIQEIHVYITLEEGLYLYDEKNNLLQFIHSDDIRGATGTQEYIRNAPVNLVYVADMTKLSKASEVEQASTFGADTGFISQNVYLFCASEGLATVVRGSVDRPSLAKKMGLRADQKIILAQTVGFPAK